MRNHRLVATSLALMSCAVGVAGEPPTFETYSVLVQKAQQPAKVKLDSHPMGRKYRTVLKQGALVGPNFAGHYTLVAWGCGTQCQTAAVIDAQTGQVYFPSQLQPIAYQAVTDGTVPLQYKLDSRLLVAAGSARDRDDSIGLHYFVWTGRALKEVLFVPKRWQR